MKFRHVACNGFPVKSTCPNWPSKTHTVSVGGTVRALVEPTVRAYIHPSTPHARAGDVIVFVRYSFTLVFTRF